MDSRGDTTSGLLELGKSGIFDKHEPETQDLNHLKSQLLGNRRPEKGMGTVPGNGSMNTRKTACFAAQADGADGLPSQTLQLSVLMLWLV